MERLVPVGRRRQLVAGTTRLRRWPTAAAEQSGDHAEGLLPGFASNSTSRPGVDPRESRLRRLSEAIHLAAFRPP